MSVITQQEADRLLALAKRARLPLMTYQYPALGQRLQIDLDSLDAKESFTLDVARGRIIVVKGTYQHRVRTSLILARLDFGGPPHCNPDGEEIATPHLHLYREGYGDRWAQPLRADIFPTSDDRTILLTSFMVFCQIVEPPRIQWDLFS